MIQRMSAFLPVVSKNAVGPLLPFALIILNDRCLRYPAFSNLKMTEENLPKQISQR
jgi:hypothetical protein